jgi:glycosyltransferase involved in cell wall biosynthesis
MKNETVKISAVICTHRRYDCLRKAIESLVNQSFPKEFYEVIIVNNASSSKIKELVDEFSHKINVRYMYEPDLGLSQARNRGWKSAKGEYVAYLDDDAVAGKDWLNNIVEVFEKTRIKLGCVGGKIEPLWESPRPQWLHKKLEVFLTILDYSGYPQILDDDKNLFGTNIAFPKNILEKLDGFNTTLGRKGKSLMSGEEALLQERIRTLGYKVFYDPKIFVKHRIHKTRLNKNWFIKRMYYEGISNAVIEISRRKPSKLYRIWLAIKEAISFCIPLKDILYFLISNKNPAWFLFKCIFILKISYILRLLDLKR